MRSSNPYWVYCLAFATLLGVPGSASANPVSVSDVFSILDHSSVNDLGFQTVPVLFVGANQVTPNGSLGTTGTGQTTNTLTNQPVNINLVFRGDTAFPNQISTGLGQAAPTDSPGLRQPWTLTFTNGTDTTVVQTPNLVGVNPLAFASNVTISPGTNPTFTWTNPSGADRQFINIVDKDIHTLSGGFDDVLNRGLAPGATSFTVPTALSGGLTLDPTHHYAIQISESQLRDRAGPFLHSNEQAVSRAIPDFTVLPSGAPPNVYIPFVDTSGKFHFNMTVIAGQTFFIDPFVALGYDFAIGQGDPNFASVVLPAVGNNVFDLFDCSGLSLGAAHSGVAFNFGPGGLNCFRVRGIEASAGLDANDTTAFVTGLTFTADGLFTGTMTPDPVSAVPEPSTVLLWGTSMAALGLAGRRRRRGQRGEILAP